MSTTAFAGAKLETLLFSNTAAAASSPSAAASVAASPAQIGLFGKVGRPSRRSLQIQRGFGFGLNSVNSTIKCEVSSNVLETTNAASSSSARSPSLSALEQLKTSAADSNSLFLSKFAFNSIIS